MGSQLTIALGAIIPLLFVAAIITFAVMLLYYFIRFVKSYERRTNAIVRREERFEDVEDRMETEV